MPINDAHCHFFSPRFFETLGRQAGIPDDTDPVVSLASRLEWDPPGSSEALADRWCDELDRRDVSRAVLIASVPGDEDSVGRAVARHPSRFVGFAMLNPLQEGALAAARSACQSGALRGLCLFPAMFHHRLDIDRVGDVFEIARRHPGTIVFAHCGVLSVGVRTRLGLPSPFDLRLGNPLDLLPIAAEFPMVPVVIPHFGAGFFREALILADARPNVHFDTSSSNGWVKFHPGLTLAGAFRQALEVVGSLRLLFGSDSSFFPRGWNQSVYDAQQQALDALHVDESVRESIMTGNFARLFPV